MIVAMYDTCIKKPRSFGFIISFIICIVFGYVQTTTCSMISRNNESDSLTKLLEQYLIEPDYQQQVNQLTILSKYITQENSSPATQESLQAGINRTMADREKKSNALLARISTALLKFYKKNFFDQAFKSFIYQLLQILSCEKTMRTALKEHNISSQIKIITSLQKSIPAVFFDSILQSTYITLLNVTIDNYNKSETDHVATLIPIFTDALKLPLLENQHQCFINKTLAQLHSEKTILEAIASSDYDEKMQLLKNIFGNKKITITTKLQNLFAQALVELFTNHNPKNIQETHKLIAFYTQNPTSPLLTTTEQSKIAQFIQTLNAEVKLFALHATIATALTNSNTKNLITDIFTLLTQNPTQPLNDEITNKIITTLESLRKEHIFDQDILNKIFIIANNLKKRPETSNTLKNRINAIILPNVEEQTTYNKKLIAVTHMLQEPDQTTLLQDLSRFLAATRPYPLPAEIIQEACKALDKCATNNILDCAMLQIIKEMAEILNNDTIKSTRGDKSAELFLITINFYIKQTIEYHEIMLAIKQHASKKLLTQLKALFVEKTDKPTLSFGFLKEIVEALRTIILKDSADDSLRSIKEIALAIAQQPTCQEIIANTLLHEIIPLVESQCEYNNITRILALENYETLLTELRETLTKTNTMPLPQPILHSIVAMLQKIYVENLDNLSILEALIATSQLLLLPKNIDPTMDQAFITTLSQNLISDLTHSLAIAKFNNGIQTALAEKSTRRLLKQLTACFATNPILIASKASVSAIIATLTVRTRNNQRNSDLLSTIQTFTRELAQQPVANDISIKLTLEKLLKLLQTFLDEAQSLKEIETMLSIPHGVKFIQALRNFLENNSTKLLSEQLIDRLINKIEAGVSLDPDTPQSTHDTATVIAIFSKKHTLSKHASHVLTTVLSPRVQQSLNMIEIYTSIAYALSQPDLLITLRLLNQTLLKNNTVALKSPLLITMVAMLQKTISQSIQDKTILIEVERLIGHLLNQQNLDSTLNYQLTKQIIPALQNPRYEHSIAETITTILALQDTTTMLERLHETFALENSNLINSETLTTIATALTNLTMQKIGNKKNILAIRQLAHQLIAHPRGELSMKNQLTVELLPELQNQLDLA